jgi:hypothetical protein
LSTDPFKTLLNASGLGSQLITLSSEEVNLDGCMNYLDEVGEEMGEEWELIDEVEPDYDLETARDAMWAFARVPSHRNLNGKSEQDTEIIKVRYVIRSRHGIKITAGVL